jgi:hypothetical protein
MRDSQLIRISLTSPWRIGNFDDRLNANSRDARFRNPSQSTGRFARQGLPDTRTHVIVIHCNV